MTTHSRRDFLWSFGGGLGGLALAQLMAEAGELPGAVKPKAEFNGGLHHGAKVTRVVQLFMNGGVSQPDTFDYKPALEKGHGKPFDPGTSEKVEGVTSTPGNLMKSPFPFKQHGQCGRWVSSMFPHLATQVDRMAFLMAVASKSNVHGPASYMMNTGFILPGFPCMGAWLSYGLGRLTDNLPTFVVLPDARGLPYNQKGNFGSGFLPVAHAGTILNAGGNPPIPDLAPSPKVKFVSPSADKDALELLGKVNRTHADARPGDSRLEARIESYELAAKMQQHAPEALDLNRESEKTRAKYGLDQPATAEYGRRCLLARRLLERGVRFIQVWSGAGGPTNNWDNHTDIIRELPPMAKSVDQPSAALLQDLHDRGMLADTLVVFSTEFGRQPFTQGATGRDHNQGTSVAWLAGAGVKGGVSHGESDPWSWRTEKDRAYCYDIHATILHLMGIDHTLLSVRHDGTDRRLTDVHGHVIEKILT
ncbi:arylsulfatase a family protein : Uncharacterized protein OS=Singulisphaera acidiphila (strain ATCC BAA-1392 / DSM 18658 / VKM B-2454 / MOB10) GN=Sinac_7587 PE=4 SV=1: DUF1501 [Gemmata massiliana]|uniref:DUF1501 domain-containing protein n=1 Tax=Gemmata massiliana TaxID=1210884 RepID=A0A6P2CRN0_9BACT|nr:DUF1501 domain-containing protein [Gemmata massiliana]VTR91748.1 arylsulfatase a family protein : Uncharacterized protein OS=Singulisphaera acidiphila (strain ATCC BAA-1392 / DSM 18658 / VKM B-2454 / MOB10) GN=Sinac_7587 PE=4 SV=1: DUF1501 [Gemmata massiliana]